MSAFSQFMAALGSPDLEAAAGYLHYRSTDVSDTAGASADIERIEDEAGIKVIASVWSWSDAGQGPDRDRVGRLVFALPGGELLGESQGDVGEVVSLIATMQRMEG